MDYSWICSFKRRMLIILVMAMIVVLSPFYCCSANAKTIEDGFSYQKLSSKVKKEIKGISYHKNKYITYDDLRLVKVKYIDYKGNEQSGRIIVNKLIAKDVCEIFLELYEIDYPIRSIELVDKYNASDDKSMEADNTTSFNFRQVNGGSTLSMHALGLAIDINPKINPCVGGTHGCAPANGKVYAERDAKKCKGKYKDNMIHKNDECYKIFKDHGFSWGGEWKSMKDYQHFSKVPKKYRKLFKYSW